MVPDPYKALGLSHDASTAQIKKAYRCLALKYHPDRVTHSISAGTLSPSSTETKEATDKFSSVAAAYQLLSDPRRKNEYDHIYKFGGYDDEDNHSQKNRRRAPAAASQSQQPYRSPRSADPSQNCSRGRNNNGIGYSVIDPVSFILSMGKQKSAAVAGIQIPSRIHLSRGKPGGGVRIAFSSGQYSKSTDGGRKYVSSTTQFVEGKKYSRTETTTVHSDGRKEVIIEGGDYVERRYSNVPVPVKKTSRPKSPAILQRSETGEDVTHSGEETNLPWYMEAWHTCREKLSMCHNPCGATLAH